MESLYGPDFEAEEGLWTQVMGGSWRKVPLTLVLQPALQPAFPQTYRTGEGTAHARGGGEGAEPLEHFPVPRTNNQLPAQARALPQEFSRQILRT